MVVVCVNNSNLDVKNSFYLSLNASFYLSLNKSYFVSSVNFGMNGIAHTYTLHGDDGILSNFCVSRFLPLEEWMVLNRDNKLSELGI